jgi:hypothetical protein
VPPRWGRRRNSGPCARLQPSASRVTAHANHWAASWALKPTRRTRSPSSARFRSVTPGVDGNLHGPMVRGRATARPSRRGHRRSRRRSPAIGARRRSEDAVAPLPDGSCGRRGRNGIASPRRPRTDGGPQTTAPGVGLRHSGEARRSRAPDTEAGASVPRTRLLIRQVGVHPWSVWLVERNRAVLFLRAFG